MERHVAGLEATIAGLRASQLDMQSKDAQLVEQLGQYKSVIDALREENKQLKDHAANPYTSLGEQAQGIVNAATAEAERLVNEARRQVDAYREEIRQQAETEAKAKTDEATAILTQAKQQAAKLAADAQQQVKDAQAESDRIIAQAQAQAQARLDEAVAQVKARIEQADQLENESHARVVHSRQQVEQARKTLSDLEATLHQIIGQL